MKDLSEVGNFKILGHQCWQKKGEAVIGRNRESHPCYKKLGSKCFIGKLFQKTELKSNQNVSTN